MNKAPKGCHKKNAEKETLVHTGGEGGKKNPPFLVHQKGDIFLRREGSKSFCHMSHVQFSVSVSSQFLTDFFMEKARLLNYPVLREDCKK